VLIYFALYLGYLAITLENEFAHWLSLVVIPFARAGQLVAGDVVSSAQDDI
jgi:hypothetical protein